MKSVYDILKDHRVKIEKERREKTLYDDCETYVFKKWKKELKEYNEKHNTDIIFCYEKTDNKRYAVNRGKHTMEWQKENWKEKKKEYEKKNIPALLYKGNEGLLGRIRKMKWREEEKEIEIEFEYEKVVEKIIVEKRSLKDLPEKITLNGEKCDMEEIEMELMKNHFEIFEIM